METPVSCDKPRIYAWGIGGAGVAQCPPACSATDFWRAPGPSVAPRRHVYSHRHWRDGFREAVTCPCGIKSYCGPADGWSLAARLARQPCWTRPRPARLAAAELTHVPEMAAAVVHTQTGLKHNRHRPQRAPEAVGKQTRHQSTLTRTVRSRRLLINLGQSPSLASY